MISDIQLQTGHGIRTICQVLCVPRSSYYHASEPTACQSADVTIGDAIESIFKRHRRRYGYRRIHSDLSDQGIVCAAARVRRIMEERGLKAIQPKTYVLKTSDGRADRPSPNLLLEKPLPTQANRVWTGDITYIPIDGSWRYLAVIIDLSSRRIVGWALADQIRTELVTDALKQALGTRTIEPGLIFHSDRGSQYGSRSHRQMLAAAEIRQSMSARANPYHNAWTESFMGNLKNEMLQGGSFADGADARIEIFDFIESYYNHHRKHSSLNNLTPAQFEAETKTNN